MSSRDPATPASNPRTMTRLVSIVLGAGVAVVAFTSCRKPPPDEIVYTGASRTPGSAPGTGGGAFGSGGSGGTGSSSGRGGSGNSAARGGIDGTGATASGGGTHPGGAGESGAGGEGGTPEPPGPACRPPPLHDGEPFSKRLLLEASGTCAAYLYCEFHEEAVRLHDATQSAADDGGEAARRAWHDSIAAWQRAEVFQFGPAALGVADPGGSGLRDHLYSWPLSASCKVDEQLVNRFYASTAFFGPQADSSVNGRSLHALEYLLFHAGTDNGCTPYSTINTSGSWSALVAGGELPGRRLAYAARATEDVLRQTELLRAAWDPAQGDFAGRLVHDRSLYPSEQAALNAVSNALFYVDNEVKDLKLGLPLGLVPECPLARCPSAVESTYARASVSHLARNFVGFRRLFQGCGPNGEGVGFDDWLVAVGAEDLAQRMLAALSSVEEAVAALPAPLQDLIVSNPVEVEEVHAAVKRLTDLLKTEFVTTLNLELPRSSEGDND